jgi:hypothetical protein
VVLGQLESGEPLAVEEGALLMLGLNVVKQLKQAKGAGSKLPNPVWRIEDALLHSAHVEPGFSGGPLVDMDGRLLGVNTATALHKGSALAFSITVENFRPHLPQLGGGLPAVSAGLGDGARAEHDELFGIRTPLKETLWILEGLDRYALALGIPPERVDALSQKFVGKAHERVSQGAPSVDDLVGQIWKDYFVALKREYRSMKQEHSSERQGAALVN